MIRAAYRLAATIARESIARNDTKNYYRRLRTNRLVGRQSGVAIAGRKNC